MTKPPTFVGGFVYMWGTVPSRNGCIGITSSQCFPEPTIILVADSQGIDADCLTFQTISTCRYASPNASLIFRNSDTFSPALRNPLSRQDNVARRKEIRHIRSQMLHRPYHPWFLLVRRNQRRRRFMTLQAP